MITKKEMVYVACGQTGTTIPDALRQMISYIAITSTFNLYSFHIEQKSFNGQFAKKNTGALVAPLSFQRVVAGSRVCKKLAGIFGTF